MYVKEINTPFGLLNPHISQLNFFLPVRSLRHHPTLSRVKPKNGHKKRALDNLGTPLPCTGCRERKNTRG